MPNVTEKLLKPLSVVFMIPSDANEKTFFEPYHRVLSGYQNDVLEEAANIIIGGREKRTFPLPADCLIACREARQEIFIRDATRNPQRKESGRFDEWSKERIVLADRLIQSLMGRQAAEEGWIMRLHDFCRENSRLPDEHEARQVRMKGAGLAGIIESVSPGEPAYTLAQSMQRKLDRLAEIVAGA